MVKKKKPHKSGRNQKILIFKANKVICEIKKKTKTKIAKYKSGLVPGFVGFENEETD